MIELLRIIFVLSKWRIWSYIGRQHISTPIYIILLLIEWLFIPIRKRSISSALRELGPIYIKFGQVISSSPNLVGEEVAKSLSGLQDKLPPFPAKKAISILEGEIGAKIEEIFQKFEHQPIAAASIAQVHKAILKNGEIVAVKILRPGIEKEYAKNIKLLYFLCRIAKYILPLKYDRFRSKELIDIFNETMQIELDMKAEASLCLKMANNLAMEDIVVIPNVYLEYTSRKVLVTSFVDGISIYDKDALIASGWSPDVVAERLAVLFFNQIFRDGFFHADPHPGNIIVTKDNRIALIDFGIMGKLSDKERIGLAEIVYSILKSDYEKVAKIHIKLGYVAEDVNIGLFAESCRDICEPLIQQKTINEISIGKLLEKLLKMSADFNMKPQHQLFLLQKTIIVLEGIAKLLNPNANMWTVAEPWIKTWAIKNISPEAKFFRFLKKIFNELME